MADNTDSLNIVPKGVGMAMQAIGRDIAEAIKADNSAFHVGKLDLADQFTANLAAGKFGPAMTAWIRRMATEYLETPMPACEITAFDGDELVIEWFEKPKVGDRLYAGGA